MEKILIISMSITVIYSIAKFVEMKFIENDVKPLKIVVRDALIVGSSSFISLFFYFYLETYLFDFFNIITNTKTSISENSINVFTDDPNF
jgi:hypothetical protein